MEEVSRDPLAVTVLDRFTAADKWLEPKRAKWDEYDKILVNQLGDSISAKTKSNVNDPKMATMLIERSNRVMAQMMQGKFRGMNRNDKAVDRLMNLIFEKYVTPNAKAQFDFLIKNRIVDLYSGVHGIAFTFIDWDVKPNGYVGPDMWLLNIRDVFPQVGAMSLEDSDYIIIRTWKPYSYFESLKDQSGYKNITEVLNKLRDKSGDKDSRDSKSVTPREDDFSSQQAAKNGGYFEVLSMYERERWVDYVKAADTVIRDIKNPHDNGELPVVCKYSIPLMDDFMGMGDFERGLPMQKTINSLWNLYLDTVKRSLDPPIIINKNNVASMSSIKLGPAEKWIARGDLNQVAKALELNPQGISTFNNTYQMANAALLNSFGTTDTSVTAQADPGFGKTPEALKKLGERENSRDNADRFYMERFLTQVANRMGNLIAKKMPSSIQVRLFEDEINKLTLEFPEMADNYNEKTGKLSIKKGMLGSVTFDYEIVPGSTYMLDQAKQNENLLQLLTLLTQNAQMGPQGITAPMVEILRAEGVNPKISELVKRIAVNSGIQDYEKIMPDQNEIGEAPQVAGEDVLNSHMQQFMQQLNGIPAGPSQPDPNAQMMQQDVMQQPMGGGGGQTQPSY